MKIDDSRALSASLSEISKSEANGTGNDRTRAAGTAETASGDRAEVTGLSRVFAEAMTAGEGARAARVAQLRQIYVQNDQVVPSEELSDAIVTAELNGRG